jgi:hypothetical protein
LKPHAGIFRNPNPHPRPCEGRGARKYALSRQQARDLPTIRDK